MTSKRKIIFTIMAILVAGVAYAVYLQKAGEMAPPHNERVLTMNPVEAIHPDFTLTRHDGMTKSLADYRGQYVLVYFGFTYCPDICPTTLQIIATAMNQLGPRAEKITPVLITVDPMRDTPEAMAEYVAQFHPRLEGFTGDKETIDKVAKTFRAFYQKVESNTTQDYQMNHSSYVYVINPEGQLETMIRPDVNVDEMGSVLRRYAR